MCKFYTSWQLILPTALAVALLTGSAGAEGVEGFMTGEALLAMCDDETRPVPNLYGRSRSKMRWRLRSHSIICLGDEVVRPDDVVVLV